MGSAGDLGLTGGGGMLVLALAFGGGPVGGLIKGGTAAPLMPDHSRLKLYDPAELALCLGCGGG